MIDARSDSFAANFRGRQALHALFRHKAPDLVVMGGRLRPHNEHVGGRRVGDQMLEALRELLSKNGRARRQAGGGGASAAALGQSERRACSIVGADRKIVRYRSRRAPETELRGRLRELANERRRFGYRLLFILLRREGELPSWINRIYRLYRDEGLTVRKRRSRRRAVGTRPPILVEAKPNARWSMDFVHDQFACGRRFRVLNIVDDVTRECLTAIADTSISGRRVARELAHHVPSLRRSAPGDRRARTRLASPAVSRCGSSWRKAARQ